MTSSIWIEQSQCPQREKRNRIPECESTHIDLKVFAEADVVSYAIEAYMVQDWVTTSAWREGSPTTDL